MEYARSRSTQPLVTFPRFCTVILQTCALIAFASAARAECTWLLFEDTQYYRAGGVEAPFYLDYALADPPAVVIHPGDVTNLPTQLDRYQTWAAEMDRLEPFIPYIVVNGNHDGFNSPSANYTAHFGAARYSGLPWYLESFDDVSHAIRFECDGVSFLLVGLQWKAPEWLGVLQWAEELIQREGLPTVLVTHEYGFQGGTGRTLVGEDIWLGLISTTDLIVAVLSGHKHERTQVVANSLGSDVLEIMANYQNCDPDDLGDICIGGSNDGAFCEIDGECPGGFCDLQQGYGQGFVHPILVSVDPVAREISASWTTSSVLEAVFPNLTYSCSPLPCFGCPGEGFDSAGSATIDVSSRLVDCNDGIDNDSDGWIDAAADPGCTGLADLSESADCSDGIDNDGDGLTDGDDPDCDDLADPSEEPACNDGIDNDSDGWIDVTEDPECIGAADRSEEPDCSDGIDNDSDTFTDLADADCDDPDDLSEGPECGDGVDNDADGLIDIAEDPECNGITDPSEEPDCSDGLDNDMDGFIDIAQDPECTAAGDRSEQPDCGDGIDNDGDGLIDLQDPYCQAPGDLSEGPECSDGVDNDGDGFVDAAGDPECTDPTDLSEGPDCDDGVDNDGDGFVDAAEDQQCTGISDLSEWPDCVDGIDNDGDALVDMEDDGCDRLGDLSEQLQCSDGIDNDGDLLIDLADPACAGPNGNREKRKRRCGSGAELLLLLPLLYGLRARSRSR